MSFPLFFARFPITRDFPWANLLLLALALVSAIIGLRRAFDQRRGRAGKIVGSLFAILTLGVTALFVQVIFVMARQLPASQNSPKVGQKAPAFTLPDSNNKNVALSELLTPTNGHHRKAYCLSSIADIGDRPVSPSCGAYRRSPLIFRRQESSP